MRIDVHGWRAVLIGLSLVLAAYVLLIAWFLHPSDTEQFLIFVGPVLVSGPITALFSHYWVLHKKRAPYWIALVVAVTVAFAWLVCVSEGSCFTSDFWSNSTLGKRTPGYWWIKMVGFIAMFCALPAFAVAAYYQKRHRRNETNVA